MLQVLAANLSATLQSRSSSSGGDFRGGRSAASLRADTPKLLGNQGYQLKHELDACAPWPCLLYICAHAWALRWRWCLRSFTTLQRSPYRQNNNSLQGLADKLVF